MYGMFTEAGNNAIAGIVAYHKANQSPIGLVMQNLEDLAAYDSQYSEATDTVVREAVLSALELI